MGNGVFGGEGPLRWHGYFGGSVREGTLVLDAKTLTPLKHTSGAMEETFSQYVEVRPGHHVPLSIHVDKPGLHFRWTFRVWEPGLWLFDTAHYQVGVGSGEKVASIHSVIVNGQPAKPMDRP